MKKILLFASAALICSCQPPDTTTAHEAKFSDHALAHKFEFDGHKYITFKYHNFVGATTIHDPDCECNN